MELDPTRNATDDDAQARYEALVVPHLDRLLGFARRRSASLADAEDAVQEACARAWLAFGELRDTSRVRPWLYQILVSVLAAAAEKAGRRQRLFSLTRLEDAHEALVGGDGDALFREVVARLTTDAVRRALDTIPQDVAVPLELHAMDGLKYREIAEVIGVPIGTVMSRIHRGRKLLQGALALDRTAWSIGAVTRDAATRDAAARRARPGRE